MPKLSIIALNDNFFFFFFSCFSRIYSKFFSCPPLSFWLRLASLMETPYIGLCPGGGGHSTFFQVGVCGPDFEVWGLRTDICLWKGGLVSGKFPNLGACELKISKFGGLWAKILVKIEAAEAKISKFSEKGVLWTDSFAWNRTLASGRRGVKRGSSGPHIPIPPF